MRAIVTSPSPGPGRTRSSQPKVSLSHALKSPPPWPMTLHGLRIPRLAAPGLAGPARALLGHAVGVAELVCDQLAADRPDIQTPGG